MKRPRKKSTIKALKWELNYYKNLPFPVNLFTADKLKHLRLTSIFSPDEVAAIPNDVISDLLINRMSREFANSIKMLPIITSYDEYCNIYRAELDLWVKEEDYYL